MKKQLRILVTHYQTTIHKFQVARFIIKTCWVLLKRALKHDVSKYSKHEAPYFSLAPELKSFNYGSQEYKDMLQNTPEFDAAIQHHYANNSHHPQFYPNGIKDMEILDVVEMLCDWKASTLKNKDGNIQKGVGLNQDRFKYDDVFQKKIINFYKELKVW